MRVLLIALLLIAPALGQQDLHAGATATPAPGRRQYFQVIPAEKHEYKASNRLWNWSAVALVAANTADIHSSLGGRELNPLVRGADGRFDLGRGVALKIAAVGGSLFVQSLFPRGKKLFAKINFGAAGVTGGVAVSNYRKR